MKIASLEVRLWGKVVGYLTERGFEYEDEFKRSGLEISPLEMPLATTTIHSNGLVGSTFLGTPGIIADCLPDSYGRNAIYTFYKKHFDIDRNRIGPLEILSYVGTRSIGALEFYPVKDEERIRDEELKLANLIESARLMIEGKGSEVDDKIIKISASAGGRQAKALVDFNPLIKDLRTGFAEVDSDYVPCIIKLDGTMDGEEPNFVGRLEYLYSRLAREAGINLPQTYLLEEEIDGYRHAHFIVERFDRDREKRKIFHYASLCGLTLRDYKIKHACSYEEYFGLVQLLTRSAAELNEAFRRCVFNIIFRVQDDHTKNFGFLMNPAGAWTLSPAFDLIYVNSGIAKSHQMTFNGKDDDFSRDDFEKVGREFGLSKAFVKKTLDHMLDLAERFLERAEAIDLDPAYARGIQKHLRIKTLR